jgi:S1-C subfamily serine protease
VDAFVELHQHKPANNAIALALGDHGRWAGGAFSVALSIEAAINAAMSTCNRAREKHQIQASCQIYSVNGNVSGESLAKLKARAQPPTEQPTWEHAAAKERERAAKEQAERAARASKEEAERLAIVAREHAERVASAATAKERELAAKERERERKANASTGTGFLVSAQGHILTANHVLQGAREVLVRTGDGAINQAHVISVSQNLDIALVKIPFIAADFIPLTHAPVRLSSGDRVFTFGFPVTAVLGAEPKYSDGAISAVSGLQGDVAFLQVTVPIQPGSSGGPLIREDGTLAGIITSSAAILPFLKISGSLPQNINWATNINAAMPLLLDVPRANRQRSDRAALIRKVRQSVVYIEAYK